MTGNYWVSDLELNRPPLIAHRLRERTSERQGRQILIFRLVIEMQARVMVEMAEYIAYLPERMGEPPKSE